MGKKGRFILPAMLVAFWAACLAEAQDMAPREIWYVAEQQGKPVGFGCDRFTRVEEGYLYTSEATLRMDVDGSITTAVSRMELRADRQYQARSFSLAIGLNDGSHTLLQGDVKADRIELSFFDVDRQLYRKVYRTEGPLYFAESFLDSLLAAGQLTVGREYRARIWDFDENAPLDYGLRVEGRESYALGGSSVQVYSISKTTVPGAKLKVDARGYVYTEYDPLLCLEIHRVAKDQIPELQAMSVKVHEAPGS